MSKPNKQEELSMDTFVDDDFDLEPKETKESKSFFDMDTYVSDETDDFFREFNKPTQTSRKMSKQENKHKFQKINTKMNPDLHKMLKIYCSIHEMKKNDTFEEALKEYIEKNQEKTPHFSNEVNGTNIEINLPNNLRNSYNFEVPKSVFKEAKMFSIQKDIKLVQLYEQAIIDYLHTKRYNF